MRSPSLLLSFLVFTTLLMHAVQSSTTKGIVLVDKYTLNKLLHGAKATGSYVLVKFDKQYAYGEKEDAWKKLGETIAKQEDKMNNVILASVGVEEWGEKFNEDFALTHGAKKENFPVFKLFKKDGSSEIVKAATYEGLVEVLTEETGLYIGLPGCSRELDDQAAKFNGATTDKERNDILTATEALPISKYYVGTMKKILDKKQPIDEFVTAESRRLKKLMEGKLPEAKKQEMQTKINILQSFATKKKKGGAKMEKDL
eukprot:PhF_6_TR21634/c0_g1_i1/m.30792/K09586/ERP29; endoplasmic reticulum protein 29